MKGLNPKMFLNKQAFEKKPTFVATRDGFGKALVELGKINLDVIVLCADLTESTRCEDFKKNYPDRFIQMGIAEQFMASFAAGISLSGKIPFMVSYATFSPGRNWEQIRTTIALQKSCVKIIGAHSGLSVGPDGATHQMLEDVALMRVLPNMIVQIPCDSIQTEKMTIQSVEIQHPYYMRFARASTPVFTTNKTPLELGILDTYRFGDDVTIIGSGPILYEGLKAAVILSKKHGIEARVLNAHSIKPFDTKTLIKCAKETSAIITLEEAQKAGGLYGVICETLSQFHPTFVDSISVHDSFGESGTPEELAVAHELTSDYIVQATLKIMEKKRD